MSIANRTILIDTTTL